MFFIRFRLWIAKIIVTLIVIGVVVGIIKLISRIKKKPVRILAIIAALAMLLLSSPYLGFMGLLFYTKTESVVTIDGVKYVAEREEFDNIIIRYYEYKNFLFSDGQIRIYEDRTSGYICYFDENGNEINE